MAELTNLETKLGEVIGLAMAAQAATEKVEKLTEDEARTRTVAATRRFARRQDGWFRKDPRITWLAHDRFDLDDVVVSLAGDSVARVPD